MFKQATKSGSANQTETDHAPKGTLHRADSAQPAIWTRALDTIPLQAKLTIDEPGDPYEQEADRVAEQVLAAPAYSVASGAPPRIQRYTGQAAAVIDAAPASIDRVLAGPGRPLDPTLRQDMEQRFGHDFSQVRMHSGAAAEQSAREVSAQAYTVGRNIVFGAGRFAPGTHEGRGLIAHELTHVVQQSAISHTRVQRQTEAGQQAQPVPDMLRIYSFGPTGAGRVGMNSGTTIFPPAAPIDAEGNELVRAGTTAEPILSRFGRYFTLDERQRPYPPPVPACTVRAITE